MQAIHSPRICTHYNILPSPVDHLSFFTTDASDVTETLSPLNTNTDAGIDSNESTYFKGMCQLHADDTYN